MDTRLHFAFRTNVNPLLRQIAWFPCRRISSKGLIVDYKSSDPTATSYSNLFWSATWLGFWRMRNNPQHMDLSPMLANYDIKTGYSLSFLSIVCHLLSLESPSSNYTALKFSDQCSDFLVEKRSRPQNQGTPKVTQNILYV